MDYNGVMMEDVFDEMNHAGFFGRPEEMPEGLRGKDIRFQFESPLHDAIDRKKGAQFLELKEMMMQAIEIDPTAATDVDVRTAFRQALVGLGTPGDWLRTQDEANKLAAAMVEERQQAAQTEAAANQGNAARQMGEGAAALAG